MKRAILVLSLFTIVTSQAWGGTPGYMVVANPYVDPNYTLGGPVLSGTVEYTITNVSGPTVTQLSLMKGDAIDSWSFSPGFTPPSDHMIVGELLLINGISIKKSESMVLSLNFTLKNPIPEDGDWAGGTQWAQAIKLKEGFQYTTLIGPPPGLVPEPGTFVLLGSSLAGLGHFGAVRRKKTKV